MTASELLTMLGFECLGPDPRQQDVTLWLRSGLPDILLQQNREQTHADDVAHLIYGAGTRDKAEEISGRWRAFTDAMRTPDLSETWTVVRALQQQKRHDITQCLSMAHPSTLIP
jgi:hypothetical protein